MQAASIRAQARGATLVVLSATVFLALSLMLFRFYQRQLATDRLDCYFGCLQRCVEQTGSLQCGEACDNVCSGPFSVFRTF